tara:strand:- start:1002 stop:2597 length:1596 start_codon:yes stop_codon:yes gene_type:complete
MNSLGTDDLSQATKRYTNMLPQGMDYVKGVAEGGADTPTGLAALLALNSLTQPPVNPPTGTILEKVTGIPSVMPQQNNQDPRLMAGVGNMPMTPRNSMDTPMTGVAQLQTPTMNAASGGIVGFAGPEGSFVNEEGYINPRDLKYAPNYIYNSPSGRQDNPEIMGAGYVDPHGRVDINAQMQGDPVNPNTSTIPSSTGLSEEALMDMQRKRDFFDMYGYPMPEVPSSEESTALKKPSLKRMMESERALPRAIAGGIKSLKGYLPFFETQSPEELAEPAEIDKELRKRTRELLIPKDDKAVREMLSGTKDGREGYLAKRDREGLIRDKRAKVAKTAADKKAAEKLAAEKAAAEKLEAEKRAKELAVEKAARKKRQREVGRELTSVSAAMLKSKRGDLGGVIGEGLTAREDALTKRETAEAAAKEAGSKQDYRTEDIRVKELSAKGILAKADAAMSKNLIDFFGSDGAETRITETIMLLKAAQPGLTEEEYQGMALNTLAKQIVVAANVRPGVPTTADLQQDFTGFKNKTVDGG